MITDIHNSETETTVRTRKYKNFKIQTEPKTVHHDAPPPPNCRTTTEARTIQNQMQEFQASLIKYIDSSLTDMTNGIVEQIERIQVRSPPDLIGLTDDSLKYKNRIKSGGSLSDKQFLARNSILSELFQLKHIRTIYNIFIVILIILFLNTAVHDVVTTGKLNLGFELIIWNFEKPHVMILIWAAMMSSTVMLYIAFFYWATRRIKFARGSIYRKFWEYCGFLGFLIYELLLFYLPLYYICKYELRPGASFTLLMEQVRLIMKTHAFIRSNIPRALAYKARSEDNNSPCPGFSFFLYFMFAPTLVYRDTYPRTKEIRWDVVSYHFAEVIGVVFYIAFIFERFLIPMFRDFGVHPFKVDTVVMVIFGAMMPGTLAFLCGFFCLLHSWMNAFAEMLQFADRMFYKDWWNVTSYAAYYRTWNIVVHDWLYTYIYKDICETFKVKHHSVVTLLVFLVSAVVHEYILSVTFKFFYPMLFLAFGGFGALLVFLPQNPAGRGNLIVWLLLCIGNGVLTATYSIEWYARINCARTVDSFLDFFVPRSWYCQPRYIP